MTVCEEMGAWAAGLRLGDVPERVRERARLQVASILAAGSAGAVAARPFARVAPDGPVGEVYAGAAASMAHDWDDYLYMGHTGHSAVWAARAFAGEDGERAAVAQIAGDEVGGRLGAALLLGPHNGQFWSSIHCAAGAVAAGVALGLDGPRLAHALAIALYQPPYGLWPGFMGPDSKLLTAAEPAADEVEAVDVEAGWLTVEMERLGWRGGWTPVGVGFSVARSVAVALVAGRLTHAELDPDWLRAHRSEVEALAARVSVRHDWELTLRTLRGAADAGASLRDVPLRAWPRVARRARETGMAPGGLDLRSLARRPGLRRELRRLLVRRPPRPGIAGIDTGALRMTFPCRLRIRLPSGRTLELDGGEPGAAGRPVAEQRAVVERRAALAGEPVGAR